VCIGDGSLNFIRRHDQVGDRGAIAFAQLLAGALAEGGGPTQLAALNLARNNLGVQGCVALADSLKFNTRLRYLHLAGVPLGRPAALAFAETIRANQVR
jgi:hypothetical protein